jgi:rubrerythrin
MMSPNLKDFSDEAIVHSEHNISKFCFYLFQPFLAFILYFDYYVISREDKKMTLEDSYRMVIAAEIKAQKMYQALEKSFARPETSSVFKELVILEKMHEEKMRIAFAKQFPGQEIILPEEPVKIMQKVNLNDPKEVLEFAISKEEESIKLYRGMAEQTTEPEIKKQLLQFANEEEGHKSILLTEIQRLQGALEWFDPSELTGLMED